MTLAPDTCDIDFGDDAPALPVEVCDIDFDAPDRTPPKWAFAPSVVNDGRWTYRDYQIRSFDAVLAAFREGYQSVIMVQATGTGKTVAFAHLARVVVDAGGKVLIIAHAEELLDQAKDKIERSTGIVAEKEKAHHHASLAAKIVVGSVQTLAKSSRLEGFPRHHFDLIITDECHRSRAKSYEKVLGYFTGKKLGVTATADRGDKQSLATIYEKCAFEFSLLEAVREGWLVRPVARTIPLEIDLKGVKKARTSQGSDYDLTEVSHRIEPFLGEIAKRMCEETEGRGQGIVFLPSVATAIMMRDALKAEGINADYVSGECEDRTQKIARFKARHTRVLCNAMLLIEGFDHDAVDWCSVLRPTSIRALYVQAVGRTTRPLNAIIPALNAAKDAAERRAIIAGSHKPTCLILDFLWLTEKLDLIAPVDLVARNDAVAKQAKEKPQEGDVLDLEAAAERDLLASLEKAAAANKGRKGRTIDPLALAVSLKTEDLASYQPKEKWEWKAPSENQIAALTKAGLDVANITTAGMASKVLGVLDQRRNLGLCTPKQFTFLAKHGKDELLALGVEDPAMLTYEQASEITRKKMMRWKSKTHFRSAKPAPAHSTPDLLP
jgi:superfamily II DNA or RNA helicase